MATDKGKAALAVDRVLAAAATAPAAVDGPCLDDGEIVEYALELMEESMRGRAARHVETCPPCLDEVIQFIEERRYWEQRSKDKDRPATFLPAREPETSGADATGRPPGRRPPRG
jgi:hypothetical protein